MQLSHRFSNYVGRTASTIQNIVLQVHEGIMAAATYVHSNTASTLQRAAAEHPGWPLLLTGHSLGGKRNSCFLST